MTPVGSDGAIERIAAWDRTQASDETGHWEARTGADYGCLDVLVADKWP